MTGLLKKSEVGDNISLVRDCKSFLLIKKCVESNKDTTYFYQDTGKFKLIKVTRIIYNPIHKNDLRIDFWDYYFLKDNLIMVTNGHVVDFGRVYSFTNYYFDNRNYFYRFGINYNLKTSEWLLNESDDYLKRLKGQASM